MMHSRLASTCALFITLGAALFTTGCGGGGGSAVTFEQHLEDLSGPRSVRLDNSNNWVPPTGWQPATSVADLDRKIQMLANRDRIVMNEPYSDSCNLSPAVLKGINPNAQVFRQYDLLAKHLWESDWNVPHTDTTCLTNPIPYSEIERNDWWLRDGDGRRVPDLYKDKVDMYFIDVGKPGVKEAFLQGILSRNQGLGYDGIVFDYYMPNLISWQLTKFGLKPPKEYPDDQAWFDKAFKPFFEYVCHGLRSAGYKVISNSVGLYGSSTFQADWGRSLVDGIIVESFGVWYDGEWLPAGWGTEAQVEWRLNAFGQDPLEVWLADIGIRTDDPEYKEKSRVALAMYYIGLPSSPELREKRFYHHYGDSSVFWDSLWSFYIGEPSGPPERLPGEQFWFRKFTNGIVLLNYDLDEAHSYTLDGAYVTPDGQQVRGLVTLPAHTALILASQ